MKKYLILTAIFYTLVTPKIFGQCTQENVIRFKTQQEVDDFPSNYPNYTQIFESISIDEDYSGVDNITNLDSLYQITSIGGSLYLFESTVTDFSGLENLNSIGGCLDIIYSHNLINFSGLEEEIYI